MGLDTYAAYPKNHPKYNPTEGASNLLPEELFPKNHLCGGMFSGGGPSFRGKVYNDWVEYATEYSLYEEEISAEDVVEMYHRLSNANELTFKEFNDEGHNSYEISYEEVQDLLKWFEIVVSEEAVVIGWW